MNTRQITLQGYEKMRIRVITWDEGEVSRVETNRTFVPNLYPGDSVDSKIFRQYRIRQVMEDGTHSPWVLQKRVRVLGGLDSVVRLRMRAVSHTGLVSEWQYVTTRTGSRPDEPGEKFMEAFLEDLLDLVVDDFIDKVHLAISRFDQVSVDPQDERAIFSGLLSLVERLPQDELTEVIEIIRDLVKYQIRESIGLGEFRDIVAAVSTNIRQSFVEHTGADVKDRAEFSLFRLANPDVVIFHMLQDISKFLTRAFLYDSWSRISHGAVTAVLDDRAWVNIEEHFDRLMGEMMDAFVVYTTSDVTAINALDVVTFQAFPTYIQTILTNLSGRVIHRPDVYISHSDTIPVVLAESYGAIDLLKKILADETWSIDMEPAAKWNIRTHLRDWIIQYLVDEGLTTSFDFFIIKEAVRVRYETVQAITDDPAGWLVEYAKIDPKELMGANIGLEFVEQIKVDPQGSDPYVTFIRYAKDLLARLIALRSFVYSELITHGRQYIDKLPVEIVEKIVSTRHLTYSLVQVEKVGISTKDPVIHYGTFKLEDIFFHPLISDSPSFDINIHERADKSILENVSEDIVGILGPNIGASLTAFIMGRFILGATPLGIT